ncbi:MAG: hypothetical protein CM1200mP10_00700 [Candidatus Neomarinimicrobiota bacterium]|nr:MAG: hypothetical protein CM1200mP10_00700 [Candidatus Neomarinimicrobiota bacterium]
MKINLANNTACVALDFNKDDIFDIDDGMKITVEKNNKEKITGMSKTLDYFDAIDCGVFKFKYSFFKTLENARRSGKFSISEASQKANKNWGNGWCKYWQFFLVGYRYTRSCTLFKKHFFIIIPISF